MKVHILLHGWLSHRRFQRHMEPWVKLAARADSPCAFPRAPNWTQSWNRHHGAYIADQLIACRLPPCELVLIGHSDGATWVHSVAHAVAARLPAERYPIVGIVHYGGLWHADTKPFTGVPAVFVVGKHDCVPGVWHTPWHDTHHAAAAYGTDVLIGAGGHRWDHRNNSEIAARLGL